jgi:serine/threonine protein kinase
VENEILAAFEAIHALNVVHGDVRSANILVAEEGNKVWIIDFEDDKILPDGDDETTSKISNEMEVVNEILRDIKKS